MDELTTERSQEQSGKSNRVEQELDWDAVPAPVVLFLELPYWLMVPDCTLKVVTNEHAFTGRSWEPTVRAICR